MKLVDKSIEKSGVGHVGLVAENLEDLWHTDNLIFKGDTVRAWTTGEVEKEPATGSPTSGCVRTMLSIQVEDTEFDDQTLTLHLMGRCVEENPYVKMGAYHELQIKENIEFTVTKSYWDAITLERIDTACNPDPKANVAVVLMHSGTANVVLMNGTMTLFREEIRHLQYPDKFQNVKAKKRFYESVLEAMLRHINFQVTYRILIASPELVRKEFFEFMMQWRCNTDNYIFHKNRDKLMSVSSSLGYKGSLVQVLSQSAVKFMVHTKAVSDFHALKDFFAIWKAKTSCAFYGLEIAIRANEARAIDTLLLSDNFVKSQSESVTARKKLAELVKSVRQFGGTTRIISDLHISGQILNRCAGIAAILRFSMPELDDGRLLASWKEITASLFHKIKDDTTLESGELSKSTAFFFSLKLTDS